MGESIPDAAVVAVLRPFVRATRPVLAGLREADPFGLRTRGVERADLDGADHTAERSVRDKVLDFLATVEVPGTSAWAAMDVPARSHWWVRRVGRFTTLVAAVPGLGGALVKRLPVSPAVGAAGQGLLLVAIAGEHGVHDEGELVVLLGKVMFRRDLVVTAPDAAADARADERAEELTGELEVPGKRPTLKRVAGAVWRLGRALFSVEGELGKRHHGNLLHEGFGMLPVVGAVATYLGEWSGLKKAAREAEAILAERNRPFSVPDPTN